MDFIKNNIPMVAAIVLVLGVIIYFVFIKDNSSTTPNTDGFSPNKEFIPEKDSKIAEILMFSVDWCPYCKKAKPEWDKLVEEYDQKPYKNSGYTLLFKLINATDNSDDKIKKMVSDYDIKGYPTIKMLKDGKVIEFQAKLKAGKGESFDQFLEAEF